MQGVGLFADEYVPKGTVVWKFTPNFDQKFTEEEVLNFPENVQMFLARYAWLSSKTNMYCIASDNGKYFNHSEDPNVSSSYLDDEDEVVTVATKDIQKNEEITDNYANFEDAGNRDNILVHIARKYNLSEDLNYR
jgi:SET domain-containing protein